MAGRGVNKVILIGNCGKDPDIRSMPDGGSVANISIATSDSFTDKNGQKQDRTEWHRVVFFNKLAEIVAQYVKKGSKLYIEGSIKTRQYDKDGVTHYSTEIIGREMNMLDSRTSYSNTDSDTNNKDNFEKKQESSAKNDDFDDDIPF